MSRTDKTAPWWVRAEDAGLREHHDHRNGECTLPEEPCYGRAWPRESCYWEVANWTDMACGCSMCSPGRWRTKRTKREREAYEYELELRPRKGKNTRKDTKKWCRGKEGKPHTPILVMQHYSPNWVCTPHTYTEGRRWPDWGTGCRHMEICAECGKQLRWSIPQSECPTIRTNGV